MSSFARGHWVLNGSRRKLAELRAQLDATQTFVDQCVVLADGKRLTAEVASEATIFAGTNEIMKEIIGHGLGLDDRKLT